MGYRYWNGTQWHRISAAEAEMRRKRGFRVIERPDADGAPKVQAPKAPAPKPSTAKPEAPKPQTQKPAAPPVADKREHDPLAAVERLTPDTKKS